jgi:hypothetical protein
MEIPDKPGNGDLMSKLKSGLKPDPGAIDEAEEMGVRRVADSKADPSLAGSTPPKPRLLNESCDERSVRRVADSDTSLAGSTPPKPRLLNESGDEKGVRRS